ncbi:hypothetical protein EJB05_08926, partial [Eragrostis curvula]
MKACIRAATMTSLWGLSVHPKDLLGLVFRFLPKLLGIPPTLLKKLQKDEYAQTPAIGLETVVSTLLELPNDVLMNIFATLDIPDLIRVGSVCSTLHAAYTSLRDPRLYKHSEAPCLFYTSESAGENVGCIYSVVEQSEYRITLPEPPIRSRFLIGSSNGWLITADERSELHLVNPFTGEQVALPSVITIEQVKPIFDDLGNVHKYQLSYYTEEKVYKAPEIYALNDLREYIYYKAFIFPDSSTGHHIVVLIHNPYGQLSFVRSGDDKWTWLPPNAGYKDCTYMDGLLYAVTSVGEIDAFDLTGTTVTRKVIMDKVKNGSYENMYIILAPWGDLLQVWRTVDHPSHAHENVDSLGMANAPGHEDEDADALENDPAARVRYITNNIVVYKVNMEAKELVKINSLPDHILFLGHHQSLCLGAAKHPQLKANHAYFTDDYEDLIQALKNDTRDIGIINLENRRRAAIGSQIWSNWPCPTWIIPNLRKTNLAFSK